MIDSRLNATRRRMRLIDLTSGLVMLAIGVVGFLFLVALIDHWILDLGFWGRLAALFVLVLGVLRFFTRRILPVLLHRINPMYAARTIERQEPSLKNSLVNFLCLRDDRRGVHDVVFDAVRHRAASDISATSSELKLDQTRLLRAAYALAAVLVFLLAYQLISPKSTVESFRRVLAPWAAVARPSRVTIESVEPGDARVYFSQPVNLSVRARGMRDGEPVRIIYSTRDEGPATDGEPPATPTEPTDGATVELQADASGIHFVGALPPDGQGAKQSMDYLVAAGDARAGPFRIEVLPAPMITVERLEYEHPKYTGLAPRTIPRQGDIRVLEGTRVTVHAVTNQNIRSAHARFDPQEGDDSRKADTVAMESRGKEAKFTFTPRFLADGITPEHTSYQLGFVNQDGVSSSQLILHQIEVVPDLSPEVQILRPEQMNIEVPEDGQTPIEIRALDPDFGLSDVSLRIVGGGTDILNQSLMSSPEGRIGQSIVTYSFAPRKLKLTAGQRVNYWAVATDNRVSPVDGRPEGNRQRTTNYTIVVTDARRPPDRQENQNQATDETRQAEDGSNSESDNGGDENAADGAAENAGEQPSDTENGDTGDENQEGGGPGDQSGGSESTDKGNENPGQTDSDPGAGERENPGQGNTGEKNPAEGDTGEGAGEGNTGEGNTGEGSAANRADSPSGSGNDSTSSDGSSTRDAGAESGEATGGDRREGSSSDGGDASGDLDDAAGSSGESGTGESGTGESGTGAGSKGGEPRTEDLHPGEVIEKTLEHMEEEKGKGPRPQDASADQAARGEPAGGDDTTRESTDGAGGSRDESNPRPADSTDASNDTTNDASDRADGTATDGAKDPSSPSAPRDSQGPDATPKPDRTTGGAEDDRNRGQQAPGQADRTEQTGNKPPDAVPGDDSTSAPAGTGDEAGSAADRENRRTDGTAPPDGDDPQRPNGASDGASDGANAENPDQRNPDQRNPGDDRPADGTDPNGGDGTGGNPAGDGQETDGANRPADSPGGDTDPGAGQRSPDKTATEPATGGTDESGSDGPSGERNASGGNPAGDDPRNPPPSSDEGRREQGSRSGDQTGALPQGGGIGGDPSSISPGDATGEVPDGDPAKIEFARQATDLALEHLKQQQEEPDPELLDKLNWTKEDLKRFVDRWEQLKKAAREGEQGKRELDESLRSLGLRPRGPRYKSAGGETDDLRGLSESSHDSRPPAGFLEQFNAFKKGASRAE